MGKSGQALRAAKMQGTVYTFTREQLRQHDDAVRREFREAFQREASAYMHDRQEEMVRKVYDEWDARAKEFHSGDRIDDFKTLLSYMLSISVRVLIEHFRFRPVPRDKAPGRNRTARFCDLIVDELEKITSDELTDIRHYCEDTYGLYGVRFKFGEEDET